MFNLSIRDAAALRCILPLSHLGWLRSAFGGGLAIVLSGLCGLLVIGEANVSSLPWLIAPVGASAVLVFAVPASPLAQPWPVLGGNIISSAIGLAVGHLIGSPFIAAGVAVAIAIGTMSLARCLHPPGGACALLYALGSAGAPAWGWTPLLVVVVNVLPLTMTAWLYNGLTGHPWPHQAANPSIAARPGSRLDVHQALAEVLAEWNEVIDADIDDLDAIFQAVEQRIRSREVNAPPVTRI